MENMKKKKDIKFMLLFCILQMQKLKIEMGNIKKSHSKVF